MFNPIPIFIKDFYKSGHILQYPDDSNIVYSNWTPRSSGLFGWNGFDGKVVLWGMQGFIKGFLIDYWNENFFNKPKEKVVKQYKRIMDNCLGKDSISTKHLEDLHDLGFLPLVVKSLPEGSLVDVRVPMATIYNTLPNFYWLTNFIETVWSTELWKGSTVATIAYQYRKVLDKYAAETGDPSFVQWQGHDFSMRGMSGWRDSAANGSGHLLSFTGTDTIPAILYLEEYYHADVEKELIGASVPATEHSVMCMGGKETEIETFTRLIEKVYPTGIASIVSDTWNFWNVVGRGGIAEQLKEKIMARDGKIVFRPDSGDPVKILTGLKIGEYASYGELIDEYWELDTNPEYKYDYVKIGDEYFSISTNYYYDSFGGYEYTKVDLSEAEIKGAVECLWDTFGGTVNEKGYKVLDSHVGLIYGDSITIQRAEAICERLKEKGFASTNVVFGIGSYTYNFNTRDTFGFAVKSTYGEINDNPVEIFKDPITDSGTKRSAKGLLRVEYENGKFVLYDQQTWEQESQGLLEIKFKDGEAFNEESLATIRGRLLGV